MEIPAKICDGCKAVGWWNAHERIWPAGWTRVTVDGAKFDFCDKCSEPFLPTIRAAALKDGAVPQEGLSLDAPPPPDLARAPILSCFDDLEDICPMEPNECGRHLHVSLVRTADDQRWITWRCATHGEIRLVNVEHALGVKTRPLHPGTARAINEFGLRSATGERP